MYVRLSLAHIDSMRAKNLFWIARGVFTPVLNNDSPLRVGRIVMGILFLAAFSLDAGTPQTINFPEIPDKLTSDLPFALSATASGALPVTYSIVSPVGVATVTGDVVTLTGNAGAVTVKASQAGDVGVDPAPDIYRTFVVGETTQRFVKIAHGPTAYHTMAIRADGTLWGWGNNGAYELGDGSQTYRDSPVPIGIATNWSSVACGRYHTIAVRADGTLWAWGNNSRGQLAAC